MLPFPPTFTVLYSQKDVEALEDAALACAAPCKHFWGVRDPLIQQTLWQLGVVFPARPKREEKSFELIARWKILH